MNITHTLRHLLSAAAAGALLALASCSEIPEDERFVKLPTIKAERTVLLEDFTGQACINCPKAHDIIGSLQKEFSHNFIPVAIHAGSLSWPTTMPGVVGLATEQGNELARERGVTSYPSGCINMATAPMQMDQWTSALRTALAEPTPVQIAVEASLNSAAGTVTVTAKAVSSEAFKGTIHYWVIENNITAPQFMPDGKLNMTYTHNHVFRAAIPTLAGEAVSLPKSALVEGQEIPYTTFTATFTPQSSWNLANLAVVAFLKTSAGVANAAEAPVK